MASERLRRRFQDLEDALRVLEEVSAKFDWVAPGKHADLSVKTLEEALEKDEERVYVEELDLTLSREPLKGGEEVRDVIDKIEAAIGGENPIESVVKEVLEFIRFVNDNPDVLRTLPPEVLADLLRIARLVSSIKNNV